MPIFGLAVFCVFLPDLFLILSGIVGIYTCLRAIKKFNAFNVGQAMLVVFWLIFKKWKNLFVLLLICLIYFREIMPSVVSGPMSKIQ
jgi:hypothetical protein